MVHDNGKVTTLCRACKALHAATGGYQNTDAYLFESSPDPAPARLLGQLMREDRAAGVDFATAWDSNVQYVLDHIGNVMRDREQWRIAFESTRGAWARGWRGVDVAGMAGIAAAVEGLAVPGALEILGSGAIPAE